MSQGDEKLDPFSTQVLSPEAAEAGEEPRAAKALNPRVLTAGGLTAVALLGGMIVFMSVRAEDNLEERRRAELEKERQEYVEIDKGSAIIEAEQRLNEAQSKRDAAQKKTKELEDELAKLTQNADPSRDPDPFEGDQAMSGDPAPQPGETGAQGEAAEPNPWVVARQQYVAGQAQQHYALMAQARQAPIFKGSGVPQSVGLGAQAARAGGAGVVLPTPQSQEEAEFLERVQQAQGQAKGPAPTSGRFVSSAPSAPGGAGALGALGASSAGQNRSGFTTSTPGVFGASTCVGALRCVQAGTVVQAVLATDINSELPGTIVAQIVQPVWDPTLTRIVIPSGSRLLGEYDSGVELGQTRTQVAWTRLILSTGESVALDRFPGASLSGASGVPSEVDEHWDRLLAGAALSAAFAASGAALSGPVNQLSIDPRQQAIQGGARPLQELGEERSKRYLEARPTLTVPQGARVGMLVPTDLLLPPPRSGGVFRRGERL